MPASECPEGFDAISRDSRRPAATYRLQFNREFTFHDATAIIDYLSDLGVSDIYASPIFQARSSSTHGYDVCDFSQLNSNLGSAIQFENLSAALQSKHLGLILDMVPNHMGIGDSANKWWMDVLENGPASVHANFFDIDWRACGASRQKKVVLPILGNHYGKTLEDGELRIEFNQASFYVAYYETWLPLSPISYRILAQPLLEKLSETGDIENRRTLCQLLETNFEKVNPRGKPLETQPDYVPIFSRIKKTLQLLHESDHEFQAALSRSLKLLNGIAGNPQSFNRLDALLRKQNYRLAFWRTGAKEINYRRFFDITDLAAVRMERPEVYEASHVLIWRLVSSGVITGLRIDHPDGLWNPSDYFRRLQQDFLVQRQCNTTGSLNPSHDVQAARAWVGERTSHESTTQPKWPLYVVAEKILSDGEQLPSEWTIDGTTGYDTLNLINGLFVSRENETEFNRLYAQFIHQTVDYAEEVRTNKRRILETSLFSELRALSIQLKELASETRHGCDLSLSQISTGLAETLATFPVYRTYVTEETRHLSPADKTAVETALAAGQLRGNSGLSTFFSFLGSVLLLKRFIPPSARLRRRQIAFIMRFQQLAGPAMAKGLEDTTFYRYNRLVSLNEVGGHPNRFGITLTEFHSKNAERQTKWPYTLIATATHDTKRGEDARARINVLSELPAEWEHALTQWQRLNAAKKAVLNGESCPSDNDEYSLYQTLLGVWPNDFESTRDLAGIRERVTAYMLKAARESKAKTSWINPDARYEEALQRFVQDVLGNRQDNAFLSDFLGLQRQVAFFAVFNSLAQTLLKITLPGVPDFYQGTELWDFSMVDPDNRRPVDYSIRRKLLAEIESKCKTNQPDRGDLLSNLLETWQTGQIKQYLINRSLHFRRDNAKLFSHGEYRPISVTGSMKDNVCAFARIHDGRLIIIVAPRLVATLTKGVQTIPIGEAIWKDTRIDLPEEFPLKGLRNVLTTETLEPENESFGRSIRASQVLYRFPLALLEGIQ